MTGNIPLSSKAKRDKITVMEDEEVDVDEIPDSYFSISTARVFYKIDNGKSGVLPSSSLLNLLKHFGRFFILRSW